MIYQPNINDPRVRRRCIQALDWANQYISNKPNWLSTREIDRHLGHQGRDLGRWLRSQLLICEDDWFNHLSGVCKKYVLNSNGKKDLQKILYHESIIKPDLEHQLITGNFEYEEKSNRFWNPLQFYPVDTKRPILENHGLRHHYDIQCAAPTLIKQYAIQLGMRAPTPAIDLYIKDRTSIRGRISKECEIDLKTAKIIINALFQGAMISHSPKTELYEKLQGNHDKITWLQQDEFVIQLKKDIKSCWDVIKQTLPIKTLIDKNGVLRRARISSKDKSDVYMILEKQVMRYVKKFLKRDKNIAFYEHDGWSCKKVIDVMSLRSYIRSNTGYQIELDWERYE